MLPAALRRAERVSERGGSKAWNWGTVLGERSESLSGEAPVALPPEGVLNPINCEPR
jgi:hypothetical protein